MLAHRPQVGAMAERRTRMDVPEVRENPIHISEGEVIASADFDIVVRQMDDRYSLKATGKKGDPILPPMQWCGAAKSLKGDLRIHTGWHDTELKCVDELERMIGEA